MQPASWGGILTLAGRVVWLARAQQEDTLDEIQTNPFLTVFCADYAERLVRLAISGEPFGEGREHTLGYLEACPESGRSELHIVCSCGSDSTTTFDDWPGAAAAAICVIALSAPEALRAALTLLGAIAQDRQADS